MSGGVLLVNEARRRQHRTRAQQILGVNLLQLCGFRFLGGLLFLNLLSASKWTFFCCTIHFISDRELVYLIIFWAFFCFNRWFVLLFVFFSCLKGFFHNSNIRIYLQRRCPFSFVDPGFSKDICHHIFFLHCMKIILFLLMLSALCLFLLFHNCTVKKKPKKPSKNKNPKKTTTQKPAIEINEGKCNCH